MIEGLEPCGTARSATASSSFRKSVIMASRPVRNDGNSRRVGGRSVLNTVGTQDRFELRPERNRFSSRVRWLREHEYVRQDEERGTWSPNQVPMEQARAA